MKILACLILAAGVAAAQDHEQKKDPGHASPATAEHPPAEGAEHSSGGHSEGPGILWKWANFAVLAGGLGYLIGKNAGPFFANRTAQIKKDMVEAAAARKDAEARAAEVDRRLANLEAEIARLRGESEREAAAEAERLTQQTSAEIDKIRAHAAQEIVSAGKAARMELKRYSAHLAVNLAEQKIRTRMTPDTDEELVRSFVQNLK